MEDTQNNLLTDNDIKYIRTSYADVFQKARIKDNSDNKTAYNTPRLQSL